MNGQVIFLVLFRENIFHEFLWNGDKSYISMIVGKYSFNRKSLHAISSTPNPYEQAISIIGRTLSPFDEDNIIPCFGFGDG